MTARTAPTGAELLESAELLGGLVECARIQSVLLAYQARELGPRTSVLVREHLLHCVACQAEARELAAVAWRLRQDDPARRAPGALAEWRRRRVLWAWSHPLLAWCVRRHRWIALVAAILGLLAVFAALRQWRLFTPPPSGYPVEIRATKP